MEKYNPHIGKLKKGGYGIWSSKDASLDCIPQHKTLDRETAEFIRTRMIKEREYEQRLLGRNSNTNIDTTNL